MNNFCNQVYNQDNNLKTYYNIQEKLQKKILDKKYMKHKKQSR